MLVVLRAAVHDPSESKIYYVLSLKVPGVVVECREAIVMVEKEREL